MAGTWIYLETGSQDPCYNLAFEEYVLNCRREGDYLLLWQNENTVVVGQNQNTEEEIDRAFVEEHHIRVVRRTTGGGAVYHDLGNLNYSFITDAGETESLTMERFTNRVVRALEGMLRLPVEASGRNDILVGGRKVSGTAQRLVRGRILYHGTLLFDSDPDMLSGALRAHPEKFRSKSAKSVRSRVGNIRPCLKEDMTLEEFWSRLRRNLAENFREGELTPSELAEVEKLRRDKYETWAWTYGRSPAYDLVNRRRWPGGSLEVCLQVEEGRIRTAAFHGDFLSRRSLEPLAEALRGCPLRREDVGERLDGFRLEDYFGSLGREEVLDTVFRLPEE